MKKGFTLVEVLTIIIILALVGLIAIPVVSRIISNSEKETAEINLVSIAKAAETYYQNEQLSHQNLSVIDLTTDTIKHNGKKPEKGYVYYNRFGETYVAMYYNGYCLIKDYKGNITNEKILNNECNIDLPKHSVQITVTTEENDYTNIEAILFDNFNTYTATANNNVLEFIDIPAGSYILTIEKIYYETYENNKFDVNENVVLTVKLEQ